MFNKLVKAVVVFILGVQLSGCFLLVGAAVGAGGVTWAKGRLQKDINTTFEKLHKATIASLKEMDLPIVVDRKDVLTAKVESRFADGKGVWIDLDKMTEYTSRIVIRVGVLGDQTRSNDILSRIEKRL